MKLDLSDNNFTSKAGVYIGSALLANPEYPMYKLTFENVNLGNDGLIRIIEAVNKNGNIQKLHCGIIANAGLHILADKLKDNNSLEKIVFQETSDHQLFWTNEGRQAFCNMLKSHTKI